MKKFFIALMAMTFILTSCSAPEAALDETPENSSVVENLDGVYLIYDTGELPEGANPSVITNSTYYSDSDREVVSVEEEGREEIVIKLAESDYALENVWSTIDVEESGFVTIILFTNSGEMIYDERFYVNADYGHDTYFSYRRLITDYGIAD